MTPEERNRLFQQIHEELTAAVDEGRRLGHKFGNPIDKTCCLVTAGLTLDQQGKQIYEHRGRLVVLTAASRWDLSADEVKQMIIGFDAPNGRDKDMTPFARLGHDLAVEFGVDINIP